MHCDDASVKTLLKLVKEELLPASRPLSNMEIELDDSDAEAICECETTRQVPSSHRPVATQKALSTAPDL